MQSIDQAAAVTNDFTASAGNQKPRLTSVEEFVTKGIDLGINSEIFF